MSGTILSAFHVYITSFNAAILSSRAQCLDHSFLLPSDKLSWAGWVSVAPTVEKANNNTVLCMDICIWVNTERH